LLKAILFDLVGTLIEDNTDILNTEQNYYAIQVKAIHNSLEKDGQSTDWTVFKRHYNIIRQRQKERSKQTLKEYNMCERVADTLSFFNYNIPFTSPIIKNSVDAYMKLFINTQQIQKTTYKVLRTLSLEFKLGLITNFSYYPGVYKILEKLNLKNYFKTIVTSGEIGWKKPSHKIFEIALFRLDVKPEETIFVGNDYEEDIMGAKKVGMKTIFLSKNPGLQEKADVVIESLLKIPKAIKGLKI
jgi:putative hydrolase of the HAD superfamily